MSPRSTMRLDDRSRGVDRLRAFLRGADALPRDEWDYFSSRLRAERVAPRTLLVRQGRPSRRVFFIVHGVVRVFVVERGREITLGFDVEDRFVGAYDSVIDGRAASFNVQTLEACELLSFDGALLKRLYRRHVAWERVGRLVAEAQVLKRMQKEIAIRSLSPALRYRRLLAADSWILQRVPQYLVASYLGITPETLSRIRRRL